MTAIKHTLQREVFLPCEERLVGVVHVTKVGKKKKASFLCAAVTTEKPIHVLIYEVKKADRGESFKKKASWGLRDLKILDGKQAEKETAELEMQFDKSFKWIASSISEKNAFIICLYKLAQRYLVQKPEFVDVGPHLLDDIIQTSDLDKTAQHTDDMTGVEGDYHALSVKEESDLETLMSKCEYAVSNAEAFSEQLSKDLANLDGANIHSIMGSEDQVLQLMVLLDQGLDEAMKIEQKLDEYANQLQSVKDLMEVMKDKDTLLQVKNKNHHKLLQELENMVSNLDLDHIHMKALLDGDLTTPSGISECTAAAEALQRCMSAEMNPALVKMAAVQEQQRRFVKLKSTFAKRLGHNLNSFFIQQGNEIGETLARNAGEMKLPPHHSRHRDLTPYADLMLWLKSADATSFAKLTKVYTSSLGKLYDKEVADFMESAKQKLQIRTEPKRGSSNAGFHSQRFSGSSSSLNRGQDSHSLKSASLSTLESNSDPDITGRAKFDQMFNMVLSELGPVCLAEQDFCVKFFHLSMEPQSGESILGMDDDEDASSPWKSKKQIPGKELIVENLGSGLVRHHSTLTLAERQINEEVRKMMRDLFPNLEQEINSFVTFGDRIDSFNSMYMLVRMSQHVNSAQDTGSFLSKTFGNCLVQIKRNFDKFIQTQIQSIEEFKVSKKTKCGIIPFVHNFEEFAQQAESIFRGSDRRTDLDKAYTRLVRTLFEQIGRVAVEHQKSPVDVILMENYHHMFSTLSHLKISVLEAEKKEARQKYQDSLQSYVTACLGRPLEKLNTFFEGVEDCVAKGVKEEEVGYQLAFSKQELRKVIREYPCKEVKKGLDHLYKKLEKHLSEEENLLQVVWHSMQDEFIKQYKHFEQLIGRCYPDSQISLEFTINDLLQYFSDIAQSH